MYRAILIIIVMLSGCVSVKELEENTSHLLGKCMILNESAILVRSTRFGEEGAAIVRTSDEYASNNPSVIIGNLKEKTQFSVQRVFPHYLPAASCWRVQVAISLGVETYIADYPACGSGTRESWMNTVLVTKVAASKLNFSEKYASECI